MDLVYSEIFHKAAERYVDSAGGHKPDGGRRFV